MKAIYNVAKLMPERQRAFSKWAMLLTEPENVDTVPSAGNIVPLRAAG